MNKKFETPFYEEPAYRKLPDPTYDMFVNVSYNPCDVKQPSAYNTVTMGHYRVTFNGRNVGILSASDMHAFKSKIEKSRITTTFSFYVTSNGQLRFGGYTVRSEHMDELFRAEVVY